MAHSFLSILAKKEKKRKAAFYLFQNIVDRQECCFAIASLFFKITCSIRVFSDVLVHLHVFTYFLQRGAIFVTSCFLSWLLKHFQTGSILQEKTLFLGELILSLRVRSALAREAEMKKA